MPGLLYRSGRGSRTFRNRAEIQAWNDAMVGKYDLDRFHNHPSLLVRWIEGERVRRILALLAPRANYRVLEVGGAAGRSHTHVSGRGGAMLRGERARAHIAALAPR